MFVEEQKDCFANRWLTTILLENLDREMFEIEKHNIESRPLWKPMHLQPVFNEAPMYGGSGGENLFNKGLCLLWIKSFQ